MLEKMIENSWNNKLDFLKNIGIWSLFSIALLRWLLLIGVKLSILYFIVSGFVFSFFLIYFLLKKKVFLSFWIFLLSIVLLVLVNILFDCIVINPLSLKVMTFDDLIRYCVQLIACIIFSVFFYLISLVLKRLFKR